MRLRSSTARLAAILAIVLAGGMLNACASARPLSEPPGAHPTPTETIVRGNGYSSAPQGPGAFVLRYGATELHLDPVTYCYSNGCVDGVDPDPPSVGSPDELLVFVPVAAFDRFSANQLEGGDYCSGRSVDAEVTALGDGWWSVTPRGPAGDYELHLFAYGNGAGDMFATVRWQSSTDRGLPDPTASLALIADHDGVPDSYGLELAIGNLTESPADSTATITVTAANGEALTIEATRSPDTCEGEGALYFDGPDAEASAAARLGDFPFTYRVELVLDGATYVATATFPDDLIEDHGVAVALEFAPELS